MNGESSVSGLDIFGGAVIERRQKKANKYDGDYTAFDCTREEIEKRLGKAPKSTKNKATTYTNLTTDEVVAFKQNPETSRPHPLSKGERDKRKRKTTFDSSSMQRRPTSSSSGSQKKTPTEKRRIPRDDSS
eukprot:CAMPEP_0115042586 /NCGR_PEP_ID=MMETSP0216-20121206/46354_1 /TAXON_ID=223996 /ORGANISM="Protocruzia adherens, Strain Boccale" /LENGTH=130 /DNA_ID=CAMNT_0002424729 /DNA_START=184 /DNA_END=573 /DNA_ORIENTATION=+